MSAKEDLTEWQRVLKERGPRSVSCFVDDGRWLRFANPMDLGDNKGAVAMMEVMKGRRKICELAVTLEDLEDVIEVCKGDAMRREEIKRREEIERGRLH